MLRTAWKYISPWTNYKSKMQVDVAGKLLWSLSPGAFLLTRFLPAIFFPGLSNIIGIIVYISSNAGDPSDKRDEDKKNQYSYGWSFYFGALSFIVAETVGVLAVNIYIDKNKELRFKTKKQFLKTSASPYARMPSYRYRRRRSRSSSRSTEPSPSRDISPVGMKMAGSLPMNEISMYTLSREPLKVTTAASYNIEQDAGFLQVHNFLQKEFKEGLHINMVNRRTTPVWRDLLGCCFFSETKQRKRNPDPLYCRWKACPLKMLLHTSGIKIPEWSCRQRH